MSRQAQLPPRYPFQKNTVSRPFHDPVISRKNTNSQPRHKKSVSQSFVIEEQPAWFDDLLSDSDSDSGGAVHRRSSSDPLTLFDGHITLPSLHHLKEPETPASSEFDSGLESSCTYGPNSPRAKDKLVFPDNALVSALSDYVSQNPLHYLDGSFYVSKTAQSDRVGDSGGTASETNVEMKPIKRNPGQRSRVRKLQYIAELERTVNLLQAFESELAVKVASVLQQRVALSSENSKLKQQVVRLRQEKLLADGQYVSLKREVERLKSSLTYSPKGNIYRLNSATEFAAPEASWQMLDMGRLDLN